MRVVLSDSSINSYGYRVLTSGINLERFKKNPVMLYMHMRDTGIADWGNYKAIGHWEDIKVEDDVLSAKPVFDCVDELSKEVCEKFKAGTFRSASIGIRIMATSNKEKDLLEGQTKETVTACELMEASIVDIPSNSNAVRLYDASAVALAAGSELDVVPALKVETKMNLSKKWSSVLAFLKVKEDKAEETELSASHIESLDSEMARLSDENKNLTKEKESEIEKLAAKEKELTELTAELTTAKESITSKDAEIAQLKAQIETLKSQPEPDQPLAPKEEKLSEQNDFSSFCEKVDAEDYNALCARIKEEGL